MNFFSSNLSLFLIKGQPHKIHFNLHILFVQFVLFLSYMSVIQMNSIMLLDMFSAGFSLI